MSSNGAAAEIGLIGLGTMGGNLALNIAEHGFQIAVFNRTTEKTDQFMRRPGNSRRNWFRPRRWKTSLHPSRPRAR